MTGWRVGYAAGPAELIKKMEDYQGLVTSGVSAISQLAAVAALSRENKPAREAFFVSQREKYTARRKLVEELVNIKGSSLSFAPTPGAFYAMIECSELANKAGGCQALADHLIEKQGVAVVPGDDFFIDPKNHKTYLRMSYATDEANIRNGIAAMQAAEKEIMPEGPAQARAVG
jgi:aspartate aminotransferase